MKSVVRSVVVCLLGGLGLCGLTMACAPTAAPPTRGPTVDAFAVVRATSQAAYASGRAALDHGDYLQACVLLDSAKTNDPDNRSEIQQALEQALQRCLTPPPEATAATVVAQQLTIVVATLAAQVLAPTSGAAGSPTAVSKPGATPQAAGGGTTTQPPPGAGTGTPHSAGGTAAAAGTGTPRSASGTPGPAGTPAAASPTLVPWNDPQGRFSIAAPADWQKVDSPLVLVGNGVVQFRDPSGRAEVDVAVDTNTRAVSPELYAASMELGMQQQVPGYASEQVQPGNTAGNPSMRRVFTFTQRDSAGQDHQARGFQVAVVKGSTPYVISGSAPADQYQQYSAMFDRVVESFRFS